MNQTTIAVTLALVVTPVATLAADMLPGQWEIALSMATPSAPGQRFGPFTQSFCLSSANVVDPTRLLGIAGATPSTCTYGKQQTTGNSLGFDISCQGATPMNGSGTATWTADTLSASFTINTRTQGSDTQNGATTPIVPLSAEVSITAHRTGGC